MQNLGVYVPNTVPRKEYLSPGHRACEGCGEALAVRLVTKALGRDTIYVCATGCIEIFTSPHPETAWITPWVHVAFENVAAVVSGIEAANKVRQRKGREPDRRVNFVAMAGDGGTSDIGLQALSGALERGHDFIYVCFDNEAYMNTGIQRSSATPYGASTTTSPAGKVRFGQMTWKKNMPEIAAAHNIPYVATATPSYPFDLMEKVKRAARTMGPSYMHVFSVCPTGWRSRGDLSVRLGRLAVECGVFPLYEVVEGRYKLSYDPGELRGIDEYLGLQGRFRHLSKEMKGLIEERVHDEFEMLKRKCL